jgi:hypothetical protein
MKKIYLLIIIASLPLLTVEAKDMYPNNTDSLDIFQITNNDMTRILDSIVEHETRCDYYSSNLLFVILRHDTFVLIEALGEKMKKSQSILGCLFHRGHLFFIAGSYIDESLFEKTGRRKKYVFYVSQSGEDPETGIYYIDSVDMQDDSFSYWYYYYENDCFIFRSKSTYCK